MNTHVSPRLVPPGMRTIRYTAMAGSSAGHVTTMSELHAANLVTHGMAVYADDAPAPTAKAQKVSKPARGATRKALVEDAPDLDENPGE